MTIGPSSPTSSFSSFILFRSESASKYIQSNKLFTLFTMRFLPKFCWRGRGGLSGPGPALGGGHLPPSPLLARVSLLRKSSFLSKNVTSRLMKVLQYSSSAEFARRLALCRSYPFISSFLSWIFSEPGLCSSP